MLDNSLVHHYHSSRRKRVFYSSYTHILLTTYAASRPTIVEGESGEAIWLLIVT
jgi:hypothetical protein